MSGISPATALLNSFDPTSPGGISSALTGSGLSANAYAQGLNGTGRYDPGAQAPAAVSPLAPTPSITAATGQTTSGPNVYQQALSSLQQWSAQLLITSALGINPNGVSSDVTIALEAAAQAQQSSQAAQKQAALSAAQSALDAGTKVNATA